MADMVLSAVSQETVSRGVSHIVSNVEERASKEDFQRLETAHCQLQFALERSGKLPITDVSLLRQRRMIKRSYEECCAVLDKHKDQAVVTNPSSNFSKRIIRTLSYYLLSPGDDELSRSAVRRFERHADEADRFVRNVESGCSLAHYRFFNPLITRLLQGEALQYTMVQRGRNDLYTSINPQRLEDYGVAASLRFMSTDPKMPTICYLIRLTLRLSESMDIFGVVINCLQKLGRPFSSFARAASGNISQLPTQDFSRCRADPIFRTCRALDVGCLRVARPDPLCCRASGHRTWADDNVIPSELSCSWFPEEVHSLYIYCSFSALAHNSQSSSTDKAQRNVSNDSPLMMVSAFFEPHQWGGLGNAIDVREVFALLVKDDQEEPINGTGLQQLVEMMQTNADKWSQLFQLFHTSHMVQYWMSPHGMAFFTVTKPEEKVRQKQTTGQITRRAAKRGR